MSEKQRGPEEEDIETTLARVKGTILQMGKQISDTMASGEAGSRVSMRFRTMPRPKSFRSVGKTKSGKSGEKGSKRMPRLLSFRAPSKTSQSSVETASESGTKAKLSGGHRKKNLSRRSVLTPDLVEGLNDEPKTTRDPAASVSSTGGAVLGETIRQFMRVGSRANLNPTVARERASTAVSMASQAPGRLRRGLSDTLGRRKKEPQGSLEPHPHKGLLRTGKEADLHLLLLLNLPVHSDLVMGVAFSENGMFAASAGGPEDRNIHLLYRNTLGLGAALARTSTFNVGEDDYATSFSFSPASTHLVCALGRRKVIRIFKMSRRPDQLPQLEFSFPTQHIYPISSVVVRDSVLSGTSYIATCADDGDNTLKFWSREGKLLMSYENKDDVANRKMRISDDGQLVALVAHLNPSTKLLRVMEGEKKRSKKKVTTTIVELQQVGVLQGPTEGAVRDTKISNNSTAYACSEDGTWSKFEISTSGWKQPKRLGYLENAESAKFLAIDAKVDQSVIVVGKGRDLLYYRGTGASFGQLLCRIEDAHDSDICEVMISPDSTCVLTMGIDSVHARLWELPK